FSVEVNFAAAVILALDADHVPMDLTAVAVVRFFVSLARSEMKRTGDLLVEKNVAHRFQDVGIKSERKLADVARARVGVEELIELVGLIADCFHDLAFFKIEPDAVEWKVLINRGRVEGDVTFDS